MHSRKIAGFLAGIMTLATAASFPGAAVSAETAPESYNMGVSIDLSAETKSISPYIYGINDAGYLDKVTATAVRQGGNRYSGYNWENNYSNAGADWKNSSDTYLTNGYSAAEAKTPGACALHLSADAEKNGVGYKMATIQMAGYVSADADGEITAAEAAPSARWKQVKAAKGSELSLEPDTTDDYVYMDEYVNYLVNKLGDSTTKTGINGYNLDNEPGLWSSTHKLMHPDHTTYAEMVEKSTEYASAIKAVDPNAEVFGLALFGVYAYYNLADAPDKDSSYDWFLSYYLDKMKDAEQTAGKRLIDAIDVHYYSEAKGDNRVTENSATTDNDIAARVQAPRSLYEQGYKEKSWLTDSLPQLMPILPAVQASIDQYYPGTKLALTEYNFGGGNHVSGAIAEADALGAFASQGVYLATLWPLSSSIDYQLSAIDLYTNYDGEGSSFGDTLVKASTDDIALAQAYASINAGSDAEVKVVLSNKDMNKAEKATISVTGGSSDYKSAVVYAITEDHSDIRIIDVQNGLSGNTVTVELPPLSVAQIVLSDKTSDKEITVVPEVKEKSVTYQISELEESQNGFPKIPVEDMSKLKRIVLTCTHSTNAGSSYYGGGGGLCFNKVLDEEGVSHWASKSFSYDNATTEMTVEMDGKFTIVNADEEQETINGVSEDTFIELQDWWKYSEKDSKGADVSVTYDTVTLYYDAEDDVEPSTGESTYLAGDANEDGDVNMADAVAIMRSQADPDDFALTADGKKNADVVGNDGVTNEDALAIQKYEAGIITVLPVPAE
ncbi:MAG: glycoside hydrolase [Ruminococcus sp.]|nr:glycoside hydrolase [Ruminococcus sp.]